MNHAPQLEYEVQLLDKNGIVKEHRINNLPIVQDYKILATVKNKDGVVTSEKEIPFESFTKNFIHIINNNFFEVDNATLIKTTASAVAPSATCTTMDITADATEDTYGIVVGTNGLGVGSIAGISSTVAGPDDWALKLQIEHGTSAGQLSYGAMTVDPFNYSTGEITFRRTFTNNSGGSVTVGEVGIIGNTNTTDFFLITRDIRDKMLTTLNITLADTEILTITYTFSNKSILQATVTTSQTRTITDNFLGIVYSLLTAANVTVLRPTGLSASVAFQSNPSYISVLAAAAADTYGITIGHDGRYVVPGDNQVLAAYTADFTYGTTTALALEQGQESIMNPRAISGSSPRSLTFIRTGAQRDMQNTSGNGKTVDEIGLSVKGDATSAFLIGKVWIPSAITVGDLETLRVKIRLAFMIYDPFG